MEKSSSNLAFKYFFVVCKILCVKPWSSFKKCYQVWLGFIIFANASYILPLALDLIFCDSIKEAVNNLPFYVAIPTNSARYLIIFFLYRKLSKLHDMFDLLDDWVTDAVHRIKVNKAVKRVHLVLILYSVNQLISVYCRVINYVLSRGEVLMLPAWFPFTVQEPLTNFLVVFFYQLVVINLYCLQSIVSDMYPVYYLIMINAHMEVLSQRLSAVGHGKQGVKLNRSDLESCIQNHLIILRIYDTLKLAIAKTSFLQLLNTSLALAVMLISITGRNLTTTNLIFFVTFSCSIIIRILPVCYYANQFMSMSEMVADAAYSCNWVEQDQVFRRAILFMIQKSQTPKPILAGGIVPVSLQTFLMMLRLAYSLFAVVINVFEN